MCRIYNHVFDKLWHEIKILNRLQSKINQQSINQQNYQSTPLETENIQLKHQKFTKIEKKKYRS